MSSQTLNLSGFVAQYQRFPETARLVFTAIVGAGIGWVTYEIVYWLNPVTLYRATTSWALSFLIGVARQHALHRTFTFTHKPPYWRSLGRAYLFYAASALLGSVANYTLTVVFHLHHRLAWLVCLAITALMSILLLKRIVFHDTPVVRRTPGGSGAPPD